MRLPILASLVIISPVLAACAGTPPANTASQNNAAPAGQQVPASSITTMPDRMHTGMGPYR